MDRPQVVIEAANPAPDAHVRAAVEAAIRSGWSVRDDWVPGPGRTVCRGTVATEDDARRAILAAVAGAGIIATAHAPRETIDRLVDDLRRLGPVDHVTADVAPPVALAPEQKALLALLAEGWTLGEAAARLGLSRRTADRRLADARAILGVSSTAAAIVALRRRHGE